MKEFGLKFILQDGTTDYYDPLPKEDFRERKDDYNFIVLGVEYIIPKAHVAKFEWFDLCPICGYELYENGCWSDECSNNKN